MIERRLKTPVKRGNNAIVYSKVTRDWPVRERHYIEKAHGKVR